MSRLKAAIIHLLISSAVLLLLTGITLFIWYPYPHYKYEGVLTILGLIAMVDVVLGPMFTFIVFKPGKPSLKFDLTVIAVIQIAAFIYGSYAIYSQHPEFLVYENGSMIIVPTSEIDEQEVEIESLQRRFHIGPKLVFAKPPEDPKDIIGLKVARLTQGKGLKDFPEFYDVYPPALDELAKNAINLQTLTKGPVNSQKMENFLTANNLSKDEVYLLRLVSYLRSSIIVLNKKSGLPVGYLDIRP